MRKVGVSDAVSMFTSSGVETGVASLGWLTRKADIHVPIISDMKFEGAEFWENPDKRSKISTYAILPSFGDAIGGIVGTIARTETKPIMIGVGRKGASGPFDVNTWVALNLDFNPGHRTIRDWAIGWELIIRLGAGIR